MLVEFTIEQPQPPEQNTVKAIQLFQCAGCTQNQEGRICSKFRFQEGISLSCRNHEIKHRKVLIPSGLEVPLLVNLPNGFNRGVDIVHIYERREQLAEFQQDFCDLYNIPVWKHLLRDYEGFESITLVKIIQPRTGLRLLLIFLECCIDVYPKARLITDWDIARMD